MIAPFSVWRASVAPQPVGIEVRRQAGETAEEAAGSIQRKSIVEIIIKFVQALSNACSKLLRILQPPDQRHRLVKHLAGTRNAAVADHQQVCRRFLKRELGAFFRGLFLAQASFCKKDGAVRESWKPVGQVSQPSLRQAVETVGAQENERRDRCG